jgi:hypothetical protein
MNPYTKRSYGNDPDVIAVELNNEPSHSGPKAGVTAYINRLAAAVRSTGWKKPLFYNVSQSPFYAEAVAAANIDGVSFQWYPTGLVANHEVKGNFLPNVDQYTIPYDTIAAYRNKAKMVYEFDAADLLQSDMYPAIVRSFKQAGFQWVTQFAYDPMALAYANTEYQTHYLNLAYTPSKAISLLIASKAFHRLPRLKSYGRYPADSVFDVFRVSHAESLSEMNSAEEFYYSNTTASKPLDAAKLQHLAGVGNSPVVQYHGSGAYFLDKISNGNWRLEVMPDAIHIRDPFGRASPGKEVTHIAWNVQRMKINLPDLSSGFSIRGLNDGNGSALTADSDSFAIAPGTYLLTSKNSNASAAVTFGNGTIRLNEFVAPKLAAAELFLRHEPFTELSANKSMTIKATIIGIDAADKVMLQLNRLGGGFGQARNVNMSAVNGFEYSAILPADFLTPGLINYKILIQRSNGDYISFPGNIKGNPASWDYYENESWQTIVASEHGNLQLYNPTYDRNILVYPGFRRNFETRYLSSEEAGQLVLRLAAAELSGDHVFGFQQYFGDKIEGRSAELSSFSKVIIRGRTSSSFPVPAKITFTTKDATSFSTPFTLSEAVQDIELPLNTFTADSVLLLPRPYPGFMPLYFSSSQPGIFEIEKAEKFTITIGSELPPSERNKAYSLEVESVWLKK